MRLFIKVAGHWNRFGPVANAKDFNRIPPGHKGRYWAHLHATRKNRAVGNRYWRRGQLLDEERRVAHLDRHAGAELDLLVSIKGKQFGFEFKLSDAPGTTRSMHVALESLGLEKIFVIYPGSKTYPLAPKIEAYPLAQFKGFASLS